MFLFGTASLEEIGGGIEIVDIGDSASEEVYLSPMRICSSATIAATSSDVNRTFVLTFSARTYYLLSIIKDYYFNSGKLFHYRFAHLEMALDF
jgi:hypothetical protein